MKSLGLQGVRRGKRCRTTIADPAAGRPADLVERKFNPAAPNLLWVADFSYVPTWVRDGLRGLRHRRLFPPHLGLAGRHQHDHHAVLDALEQAIWQRTRDGVADLTGLIHHNDAGGQYTSIAFTERLIAAGVDPSVGSVGDAYDNALAETLIGVYKTELIKRRGPWRTAEHVELATLEYVDWFNFRRLFEACGDIPPAELEQAYYRQHSAALPAGVSTN